MGPTKLRNFSCMLSAPTFAQAGLRSPCPHVSTLSTPNLRSLWPVPDRGVRHVRVHILREYRQYHDCSASWFCMCKWMQVCMDGRIVIWVTDRHANQMARAP